MNQHGFSDLSAHTVRPHASRLVSIEDELASLSETGNGSSFHADNRQIGPPAIRLSRPQSPAPSRHPSRSAAANGLVDVSSPQAARSLTGFGADNTRASSFTSGLWGSWSSLQNLASTMLGSDVRSSRNEVPNGSIAPAKGLQPSLRRRSRHKDVQPEAPWGPSPLSDKDIGVGSQEDRFAKLLEKKRKALLVDGSCPDSVGHYKRRNSNERNGASILPCSDENSEILVYVHYVKPEDTMAGVILKYSCKPEVFKKANGFWFNDNIQFRKVVLLPVEACSVKGSPLPEPRTDLQNLRIMSEETIKDSITQNVDGPLWEVTPTESRSYWMADQTSPSSDADSHGAMSRKSSLATSTSPSLISSHPAEEAEVLWKHDSWVVLSNHAVVEIARLPRRKLGFFPRTRRKSVSSDFERARSSSFEISHAHLSSPQRIVQRERSQSSNSHSIAPRPYSPQSPYSQKSSGTVVSGAASSSINIKSHHKHCRPSFSNFAFNGPGGVGSLSNRGATPGPSQDGLNRFAEKHLPALTLSHEIKSPGPDDDADGVLAAYTSEAGPDIGAAVGNWVKQFGRRMSRARETPKRSGSFASSGRWGTSEEIQGDLIELDDTTRGRRTEEEEATERDLDERFPMSKRVVSASGRSGRRN